MSMFFCFLFSFLLVFVSSAPGSSGSDDIDVPDLAVAVAAFATCAYAVYKNNCRKRQRAQINARFIAEMEAELTVRHGGSISGKNRNIDRRDDFYDIKIREEWFGYPASESSPGRPPIYNEKKFRRVFRMSSRLFNKIHDDITRSDIPYFKSKQPDATGKPGKSSLQKIVGAFRILAYGLPYNAIAELCGLGEQTAKKCFHEFCRAIIFLYEERYLRPPTKEDVKRITQRYAEYGFNGQEFFWTTNKLIIFERLCWLSGRFSVSVEELSQASRRTVSGKGGISHSRCGSCCGSGHEDLAC